MRKSVLLIIECSRIQFLKEEPTAHADLMGRADQRTWATPGKAERIVFLNKFEVILPPTGRFVTREGRVLSSGVFAESSDGPSVMGQISPTKCR
jgi:hypothetical protein